MRPFNPKTITIPREVLYLIVLDKLKPVDGIVYGITEVLNNGKRFYISAKSLSIVLNVSENSIKRSIARLHKTNVIKIMEDGRLKINTEALNKLSTKSHDVNVLFNKIGKNKEEREKKEEKARKEEKEKEPKRKRRKEGKRRKKRGRRNTTTRDKLILSNTKVKPKKRKRLLDLYRHHRKDEQAPVEIDHRRKLLSIHFASIDARDVLKEWNQLKVGTIHNRLESNTVAHSMYVLDQIMLKKYTKEQVIKAIKKFIRIQNNPELYQLPKSKVWTLPDFLTVSPFAIRQGYSVPLIERVINDNLTKISRKATLHVYKKVKEYHSKYMLDDEDTEYTTFQEKIFQEAAVKLERFMRKKLYERYLSDANADDYVNMLFQSIQSNYGNSFKFTLLNRAYVYNDMLPRFIIASYEDG